MSKTFWDKITKFTKAIILLEGTREINVSDYDKLIETGKSLASLLPDSTFRSGNAPGSDDAFIKGVTEVEGSRIELALPFSNHRKRSIPPNSRIISLDSLTEEELEEIKSIGTKANAALSGLLSLYQPKSKHILSLKAAFLLRDVVKITGLPSNGFLPASVGLFYLNLQKPGTGGTAFTMAVAKYMGVECYTQVDYLR